MNAEEQEAIFRRWLNDHLGLMLKLVRASAATPEDQDDLFQEVLVNVWSSIRAFRGEAKETTWIYRVAFNTTMAWRRGEASLIQVNHQIWLLKNIFWWYLLPVLLGLGVFIVSLIWKLRHDGPFGIIFLAGYALFCGLFFWGTY
ncbi:MAG: RNA polymerase sigma factor [Verrucomicrobiia bacterium]